MNSKTSILVVDDDAHICQLVKLYLDKEGFENRAVNNGKQALEVFREFTPNLVVLDIMLPGMDGWQVCREIRKFSSIPIIMLSARDETFDKVLGLELGADDYVVKPFEPKELIARIKAVLRRYDRQDTDQEQLIFPGVVSNNSNYRCGSGQGNGNPPKELNFCFFLASNPNKVFHRSNCLENVWALILWGHPHGRRSCEASSGKA